MVPFTYKMVCQICVWKTYQRSSISGSAHPSDLCYSQELRSEYGLNLTHSLKKLDPRDYRWRISEACPYSSGDQRPLEERRAGRQ